jgi:enamine deaminase RidA (YjgF/YER057c/UK114 family)
VRLAGEPPSPWEERYSFSRVVRRGNVVVVAGTTSVGEDGAVIGATGYEQAAEILRRIAHGLERAGATLADVVQTRMFVTDISRADEIGRAHGEAFGEIRPVSSMVEVAGLIDPRMLVEIEALAVLEGG